MHKAPAVLRTSSGPAQAALRPAPGPLRLSPGAGELLQLFGVIFGLRSLSAVGCSYTHRLPLAKSC